ncbi:MAG: exodeoxyribonuclease VII large subunit [Saprospiraceae bacterium]|nr:exodeoxyribonuclease VII large subunit [Saprospiraceae bacterium]MBK9728557.1 exodeoxyribonuclease VII large subunit [Saprospiraceae bacterium]
MEHFTLSKLNSYIRRVLAINFQDAIWISAELLSYKEKAGHAYLELVEKDEQDTIIAQSSAVIWKSSFAAIKKINAVDLLQILREGNEIRVLVQVDYNARYGLKLVVQNVDAAYTLGKIAQSRLRTVERLKKMGLWQKNKERALKPVLQSIAVISSKNSAGFIDFENHLLENNFAYKFRIQLYDVSVQGDKTVQEIQNAFHRIIKDASQFDLIIILRGGGSKHDLIEFDSFEISECISDSILPVFTGIGHFIDESIADLSAYSSLKTPTAVADAILNMNFNFEQSMIQKLQEINTQVRHLLNYSKQQILDFAQTYKSNSLKTIKIQERELTQWKHRLFFDGHKFLNATHNELIQYLNFLDSNDPNLILKKGYSLTYCKDQLLYKINELLPDEELTTLFSNGSITSTINKKWHRKT